MSYRGDENYRGSRGYKGGDNSRHNDERSKRNSSKEKSRYRSRSRSRSRERKDDRSRKHDYKTDTKVREMSISPQRDDKRKNLSDSSPSPPPPPFISKVSMEFKGAPPKSVKMTLNVPVAQSKPAVVKKPVKVASVFNDASDEEPEEMPPEARMRMRNIGRDTPTSAGPNSYGKTKHGFCDQKAMSQKSLKAAMEQVNPTPSTKYPGTIYKLAPQ